MKTFKLLKYTFISLFFLLIISCEKNDKDSEGFYDSNGYTITLNADKIPGHGQYQKNVETSESVNLTVTVNSPNELKSLTITKKVNLEVDSSFGNNGVIQVSASGKKFIYTFNYEPPIEDIDQLVGFTFQATTVNSLKETSDLTVKVTLSPRDNLSKRRWNWQSILHVNDEEQPNAEVIKDCEKDNAYLFNEDGSLTLDYGSDTAAGACLFDGFNAYDSWKLTDDEKYFIIKSHGIFTPDVTKIDSFTVKTLTVETLQLEEALDLSAFGGKTEEIFLYTFKAAPRDN